MISTELHISVRAPISKSSIVELVRVAAKLEKKIRGVVEVSIVSDREIFALNKQYRGIAKPTDVLSFAWKEDTRGPSSLLGQLYLSPSYIKKQSERFHVPFKEEFARMLFHGLLHIVGYDHMRTGDAKRMFALQEKMVERGMRTLR